MQEPERDEPGHGGQRRQHHQGAQQQTAAVGRFGGQQRVEAVGAHQQEREHPEQEHEQIGTEQVERRDLVQKVIEARGLQCDDRDGGEEQEPAETQPNVPGLQQEDQREEHRHEAEAQHDDIKPIKKSGSADPVPCQQGAEAGREGLKTVDERVRKEELEKVLGWRKPVSPKVEGSSTSCGRKEGT